MYPRVRILFVPTFVRYFLKRLGLMGVSLFLVSVMVFSLTQILPGDVALMILGRNATPEALETLRMKLGLNRPLYVQYLDWLTDLLRGEMGTSLRFERPVTALIMEKLPRSLLLAFAATALSIVIAIPLGTIAAVRQNKKTDTLASGFAFLGLSVPEFMWGLLFILVFAIYIPIFPTSGYVSPLEQPIGGLRHLALPALSLAIILVAYIMRMTRSSMVDVLQEEYIRLAEAKGMSQRVIIVKHALKNAMIPVITVIAFQFSVSFGAVVVLEEVFVWPGIGTLTLTAIQNRDIPLLQGCVMVIAFVFMTSNLIADLLYSYFDPRVRYGRGVE